MPYMLMKQTYTGNRFGDLYLQPQQQQQTHRPWIEPTE